MGKVVIVKREERLEAEEISEKKDTRTNPIFSLFAD